MKNLQMNFLNSLIENIENSSELDVIKKDDDKVLEIPAFLRRQVN